MDWGAVLESSLARLDAGEVYKGALEATLLEVELDRAQLIMQLLKEGRGSWLLLLEAGGGDALLVGNALSGTAVSLARAGFALRVVDPDPARCRFAEHRDHALAHGRTEFLAELPAGAEAFDLVVHEDGLPPPGAGHGLSDLRRLCRGELVLVADNRLGYKRSSGRRADFRVPRPLEYAADVVRPREPKRTLAGYRRLLERDGFEAPRGYALYPDRRDFSQIAALDGSAPRLFVGPKERRNRVKMMGYAAGLFPLLTPSFGLVSRRATRRREAPRLERLLDGLAEAIGEPRPELDQFVATRGNTAVVHTCLAGRDEEDPEGRWTLHVPMSPQQTVQAKRHAHVIGTLPARFPDLPLPELLFEGELEGLYLSCERRLPGLSAPQLSGEHACMRRLYADVVEQLSGLVLERDVELDDERFEELVGAKFDLVTRFAGSDSARRAFERMRGEARERLLGRRIPRVVYHADLRAKHVQVRTDGRVVGYLDWGSSEDSDLPYFDLLHLLTHDRKQEAGLSAGDAWRIVLGREGLRDFERAALDEYAARVGLEPEVCRALEALYPVLVGAMAEANWDYSRPRWAQRNFAL